MPADQAEKTVDQSQILKEMGTQFSQLHMLWASFVQT